MMLELFQWLQCVVRDGMCLTVVFDKGRASVKNSGLLEGMHNLLVAYSMDLTCFYHGECLRAETVLRMLGAY